MLAAPVILADETRWPLLGTAEADQRQAWAVACEDDLLSDLGVAVGRDNGEGEVIFASS